ncbi:ApeA N-terminal domain 1-containing protein [Streptomyces zingiberis]|uniref:ApeA N-terminal domain-containing protein n=1 Tax=Streptomyces zingiberis TaxID=2053010 RepID=A0ABX1BMS6_9ACTN|nr:HEPN domain-containing protein [Streptomyces zingiberis]NJP99045.1 hypothetical protein [Streptomyces zingiberis]
MDIDDISGGSVGYFWASHSKRINFRRRSESGYLKVNPTGQVEVQTLEESPFDSFGSADSPGIPKSIFASTPAGGALVVDIFRQTSNIRWGGAKASTHSFFAHALIMGVDDNAQDPRFSYFSTFVPGIQDWAGVRTIDEERKNDDAQRIQSVSLQVRSGAPQEVRLNASTKFELSWHWQVSGSADNRSIYAPVSLAVRSMRPKSYRELLSPLHRIQDLVCLALDGFVAADGGRAHLILDPDPRTSPTLWDGRLMAAPPGTTTPKSMTEIPLFSLGDLGGVDALRRWIKIYESHPRAVRPFVSRYRLGATSPEVQLMEVAAGMEYWVASHRRTTSWAKNKRIPLAIAERVGSPFGDWIGDLEKWDTAFWETYNAIKHEANYKPDRYMVSVMAQSGSLLLTAAILNRVAGNKGVSKRIFRSHRTRALGEEASGYVANFSPNPGRKKKKGR